MTREEFNDIATEILNILDDTGAVSTKLDDLRTGFNEEITAKETVEKERDELESQNASLQKANMDLFLRIGTPVKKEEEKEKEVIIEKSYDDLFNDNGELI